MSIPSATASPWPARLAFGAGVAFLSASVALNFGYGLSKAADPLGRVVWATIACGASIGLALSMPAFLRAVAGRQWAAALAALVGLVLFGAYSTVSAIGNAAGNRVNATTAEVATGATRQRAQDAHDRARRELDALQPARPVAEVEGLLSAAKQTCRIVVENGRRETVCVPNAPLTAELGRSRRKLELEATIERTAGELAQIGAVKQANSDSKAIADFARAIGLDADADRINRLLVLLAVLTVELGSGVCFAIGMALATPAAVRPTMSAGEATGQSDQPKSAPIATAAAIPAMSAGWPATVTDLRPDAGRAKWPDADHAGRPPENDAVVAWLRAAGGRTVGIRPMADALGWPRTTLTERLQRLAGQGLVRLAPGRRGTVVELAASARAN
jgi:hypothetical protein